MLNLSYMPLRGKPSYPMVTRHTHPSTKLVESLALFEAELFALNPDRRAVLRAVQKNEREPISISDLVYYYRDLLQPVEEVLDANRIRNQYVHSGHRGCTPPSLETMDHAAQVVLAAIYRLLPHLPATARELILTDPHESLKCLSSGEVAQLPTFAERIPAYIARQDALLSRLDREENQPAYDLAADQARATPRQRFERHRKLFTPATQTGVFEAFKLACNPDQPLTPDKEFHLCNRLQRAEDFLNTAIGLLERKLGIYVEPQAEPFVVVEATSAERTPPPVALTFLEREVIPEPATEARTEQVVPVLDAVEAPASATKDRPHQCVVRLRFPLDTARLLARLTVGFALMVSGLVGVQVLTGSVSAKTEVRIANRSVPSSLIYWRRPDWTSEARNARVEGEVRLRVQVDEGGRAESIRVEQGPGYGLEGKAIDAVSQWRFVGLRRVIVLDVPFRWDAE